MEHLDLFSGIGGFALAAKWAGIETVAFCEIDQACQKVLKKHWPEIIIHKDIKNLDGKEYEGVDIITGGYPCQPFSVAGNQKASKDDRHLWPEMFRIITQAKPPWVVCENVYGHVRLGLDSVLHDLESIGYTVQPFVIPSLATGANHNRDRVFIVAYTSSNGQHESKINCRNGKTDGHIKERANENSNNERLRCLRFGMEGRGDTIRRRRAKPPPLRVDDGLPDRMDRIKMLGNSVDPLIAYEIMKVIRASLNDKEKGEKYANN